MDPEEKDPYYKDLQTLNEVHQKLCEPPYGLLLLAVSPLPFRLDALLVNLTPWDPAEGMSYEPWL